MRDNSFCGKGASLQACKKHMVEVFCFCSDVMAQLSCKNTALRTHYFSFFLSVLKTLVRYQLLSVSGSVLGSLLGLDLCFLSLCSANMFMHCWKPIIIKVAFLDVGIRQDMN